MLNEVFDFSVLLKYSQFRFCPRLPGTTEIDPDGWCGHPGLHRQEGGVHSEAQVPGGGEKSAQHGPQADRVLI